MVQGLVEATGHIQQALECLHTFRTYELSSAMSMRFEKELNEAQKSLANLRNDLSNLSLKVSRAQA